MNEKHFSLGNLLYEQKRYEEAEKEYRRAIAVARGMGDMQLEWDDAPLQDKRQ